MPQDLLSQLILKNHIAVTLNHQELCYEIEIGHACFQECNGNFMNIILGVVVFPIENM